jgi:hypothetical protein
LPYGRTLLGVFAGAALAGVAALTVTDPQRPSAAAETVCPTNPPPALRLFA